MAESVAWRSVQGEKSAIFDSYKTTSVDDRKQNRMVILIRAPQHAVDTHEQVLATLAAKVAE